MSLTPGTHVGPYEILAAIGAGGMGEVYRARDAKLNRDVALKILPDTFATDPDRLSRFRREAQLLASLNHPNIGHIYGFEDGATTHALVLELIEGPTLADRITAGPLPLAEALPLAKQIAEALEAAHEQGIVHRDLKPANVKVRDDGTVKVLDFGLAKALDPTTALRPDAMNSPTLTARGTQIGLILGTAAYMAPEQARGRMVDKRADIWAFGVVLYEMLSGRRPFHGEDVSDTLAAVIKDTPNYDALPLETPRRLRRLIERCLERDVKMRLRDIGEARVELGSLQASSDADAAAAAPVAAAPVTAAPARVASIAAGVIAGAALTALAMFVWGRSSSPPVAAARARFQLTLPESAALPFDAGGTVAVSPDGRSIVFVAVSGGVSQLWLRPIDAIQAKVLPGTEAGRLPFWSPDGAFLGFFAAGKMKRLEISTGGVQTICDAARVPGGASWNRDDVIVFAPRLESPLFRVPAVGGAPTPLTTLDAAKHESNHMWPDFLPDGRHFVFQVFGLTDPGIYIGSLDSPQKTLLIRQGSLDLTAPRYAPSGHLVYVRNRQLVAHPFDARALKLTGEPFPLAEGFDGPGGPGAPPFGLSASAALVFRPQGAAGTFQPTWFARDGSRQGTLGPPGSDAGFDLSPDGATLALDRITEKDRSIWLVDVARGTSTRFTSDGYSVSPRWSPLGDRLVFGSVRDTPPNPFVRTLAGGETRLARLPRTVTITTWAPDGRTLIGQIADTKTQDDLWLFSSSGDRPPAPFIQTPFRERMARISPDGRWVAFTSNESGVDEIYVTTFPAPGRRVRVSTDGGTLPRWRDDGAELFFETKNQVVAVGVKTLAVPDGAAGGIGFHPEVPRPLFTLPEDHNSWIPSNDGRRFLVGVPVEKAVPAPITVMLNWSTQGKNPK
jgi:Tol biopolymer transport system component